ncbi:two-component system, OmpR family, alkaline phosphatase synthesis response regulator PhoP [Mucilaginibacter pineti]|uniref:Two-component system, OmpR family, alkaline phosphatase synthesis response regulator PhoP n=1 Tax=Mucilaginibacter pineti TaxID=1391627 RepID=A0A1G7EKG9_9SPHI|nr:response regulator transcription factor [Mucilaginibacter pineti]SDE63905.1 two-component system, OmpR family, alkaline phosphatase synthesis response regulator PhoP [Mucilaginibacter pineti]
MKKIADPKKIVLVDDDSDIRDIMTFILESEGYTVIGLDKGLRALETITEVRPDLVLLDAMLGDMDGRDICKSLKQQAVTRAIPVVIVSASHGWHTAHEKKCGADNYLPKPFDIADLVSQVKQYAA